MTAAKLTSMRSQMLPRLLARMRDAGADAAADALVTEYGLVVEGEDALQSITVPLDVHKAICERAAEALGDPAVGFHTATSGNRGHYGLVEFTIKSSRTLRDALERLCRYMRLLSDVVEVRLDIGETQAIVTHEVPGEIEAAGRHANEYGLAMILRFGREFSGVEIVPLRIEFAHAAPADRAPLAAWFGTDQIFFGATKNRLVLARKALDAEIATSDEALLAYLDQQAQDRLPKVEPRAAFRRTLAAMLGRSDPSLEALAERMHMSARTLQRRLKDDGTTFQGELDAVRRALVAGYLADSKLSIYEIATLLGYTEQRAFERAFRRWYGATPKSFRARMC